MRFLAVVAVALAATQTWAPAAASDSSTRIERRPALETSVIREINRVRASHGLGQLGAAPGLRTAARSHSRAMLLLGFFGHDSADGTAFSERIKRYYPNRGWHRWSVGETLLARQGGAASAADVVAAWLDSPPHRALILSPTWREAGVAALYAPAAPKAFGGTETLVVTADFGVRVARTSP